MRQKSGALRLPRLAGVSEHASQCGVVDGDDRHGKIGDAIDSRDTIARMIPIADVLYDTFISASGAPSFRAGTGRSPHQASRTRRIAESRSDSTLVVARWMHLKILTGFVCHCKLKGGHGQRLAALHQLFCVEESTPRAPRAAAARPSTARGASRRTRNGGTPNDWHGRGVVLARRPGLCVSSVWLSFATPALPDWPEHTCQAWRTRRVVSWQSLTSRRLP
jgi:hypothetical protein